MSTRWKIVAALALAGALGSSAYAQTATPPAAGDSGSTSMSGDSAKQQKKAAKKAKTKAKRERNQNGANGPAEVSSKPQPAAGTGSQ